MRHTITVTVEVESTSRSTKNVADALIGMLTNCQEERFESATVHPGGKQTQNYALTMSVVSADAMGTKSTAGWAVNL